MLVLDTNILSEIRRLTPEPKVLAFVSGHALDELYISTVTLAELRFGIELLSEESNRRDELKDWLTHTIRPMFDRRVLPVTEDIMFRWRVLLEQGRKTGYTYSQPDLIIAATAELAWLTVLHLDKDFEVIAAVTGQAMERLSA